MAMLFAAVQVAQLNQLPISYNEVPKAATVAVWMDQLLSPHKRERKSERDCKAVASQHV